MKKLKQVPLVIILFLILGTYSRIQDWIRPHTENFQQAKVEKLSIPTQIDDWSYDKYPDYYSVLGEAQVDETKLNQLSQQLEQPNFVKAVDYTGKDQLGRTQAVYALVTLESVKQSADEERPDFKRGDNPSGWSKNHKVKVDTSTGTYSGWFWNRSHLLADRLGGETTSNNAITGTRMQNVGNRSNTGGMYYIEEKTVDYLRTHRTEYVYYAATPVYNGDELIPRYVIVDAKSSDGELNEHVVTYNYQNGYTINYLDGSFTAN